MSCLHPRLHFFKELI
uniref:Uncharacterized protein n=1 Tax=Arundo donax TaxID=35708 RepID=A0A0A9AW21_ARUDO